MEKMKDQKLSHQVLDYNHLKAETKSYELQEKLLKRMAQFCGFVFAFLFAFTIYGYWVFKNKQIELLRKANTAEKAKINLSQKLSFLEQELRREGMSIATKYEQKEDAIRALVDRVVKNPNQFSEVENKIALFWHEHEDKLNAGKVKEFEELLFYKSVLNLMEQV